MKGFGQSDPNMVQYAYDTFKPEDDILRQVREESERQGLPKIQVGAFDSLHLEILVRLSGAKKAVEIGTLGGYSGIAICRGMGPAGRLTTFELSQHHADVARENFVRAGVLEQVTIHVGPALENLKKAEKDAPFDLVFIDADKVNYPNYFEWSMHHLRVGGAIIADNTFGWGWVNRPQDAKPDQANAVYALQEFNRRVAESPRFRSTILPTAEGFTLAVKTS